MTGLRRSAHCAILAVLITACSAPGGSIPPAAEPPPAPADPGTATPPPQRPARAGDAVAIPPGMSLVLAARYGQDAVLRLLLDRGTDIGLRDELGRTALIVAAAEPRDDIVDLLIRRGADVDAQAADGSTALMSAAARGHIANMERLIRAGAAIDARNAAGETPLMVAIKFGQAEAVDYLLDRGAEVNPVSQEEIRRTGGYTPLMYAARYGASMPDSLRIVRRLLASGALPNVTRPDGETALTIALRHGHRPLAEALRRAGARDESPYVGLSPGGALLKAIERADLPKVEALLQDGVDPDYRDSVTGVTPLGVAAYRGDTGIVTLLLDHGADVDNVPWGLPPHRIDASGAPLGERALMRAAGRGDTALLTAIRQGHAEVARRLLERGASLQLPNREGETPGLLAARRGEAEILQALLARGLDPNLTEISRPLDYAAAGIARPEKTRPLLIEAARNGHVQTVRVLMQAGADPMGRDEQGRTALHWAVAGGDSGVVRELLAHGADPNARDAAGGLPLPAAVSGGHAAIVRQLLDHGADPDAIDGITRDIVFDRDRRGTTALIQAVRGGHTGIVRMLLEHGADTEMRTDEGEKALDIARRKGDQEVIRLLAGRSGP